MHFGRSLIFLILALTLSACAMVGGSSTTVRASISPTLLGFEVDDDGTIVVAANNVSFLNQAGAAPATITYYEARFYDDAGLEIFGTDIHSGHLAISVPAGMVCPTEEAECSMASMIAADVATEPTSFILLPGGVATHMLTFGLDRVLARITFGVSQYGRDLTFSYDTSVTYPVNAGD